MYEIKASPIEDVMYEIKASPIEDVMYEITASPIEDVIGCLCSLKSIANFLKCSVK
jgi:hypothetical protein